MEKILAFDPSGNWEEGKGTTGVCKIVSGVIMYVNEIKANIFDSPEEYWQAHLDLIGMEKIDCVVIEGFKLYKGKATTQINSQFETPQLIGVIRQYCYQNKIPLVIQYASEVKSRWHDRILLHEKILEKSGKNMLWNGQITNDHKRDAIRHALHFYNYGRKKL